MTRVLEFPASAHVRRAVRVDENPRGVYVRGRLDRGRRVFSAKTSSGLELANATVSDDNETNKSHVIALLLEMLDVVDPKLAPVRLVRG